MNTLNIIGYSLEYSEILPVLFAVIPNAPPMPKYVKRHGGDLASGLEAYITISWEPPYETGGVEILGYLVKIQVDGGTFETAYDGQADPDTR
jgi:hypothetical protein